MRTWVKAGGLWSLDLTTDSLPWGRVPVSKRQGSWCSAHRPSHHPAKDFVFAQFSPRRSAGSLSPWAKRDFRMRIRSPGSSGSRRSGSGRCGIMRACCERSLRRDTGDLSAAASRPRAGFSSSRVSCPSARTHSVPCTLIDPTSARHSKPKGGPEPRRCFQPGSIARGVRLGTARPRPASHRAGRVRRQPNVRGPGLWLCPRQLPR